MAAAVLRARYHNQIPGFRHGIPYYLEYPQTELWDREPEILYAVLSPKEKKERQSLPSEV